MKAREFFIAFTFFVVCIPCFPQQETGKRVTIRDDNLSVNVRNAPLFDILKEIGTETGMEVKVDPEVNKNVTASFENVPIDRGIARLIHPLDYVMKWKRITDGEESVDEITAVEIFKKGERGKAQQVLSQRHPSRDPKDYRREDIDSNEREMEPRPRAMQSRRKRPRKRYKSSVTKMDQSKSGEGASGSSVSSGHVRIRKFEAIPDTDSYDELSP